MYECTHTCTHERGFMRLLTYYFSIFLAWLIIPWSKGFEFESRQERREIFFLQSQLCVLTLIRCPFHPRGTAVARKRPRSFCQKCKWQVKPRHANTLDPTKSEWADYAAVHAWCGSLSGNELTHNLSRNNSATVLSARWATVNWSWYKEWN